MILCALCNCENDNIARKCANCGKPLVRYNSVCGMPMLGGSSRDQVLNRRYIIDKQLSEDKTVCIYEAEDVIDNAEVLIIALPLSVQLTSSQIEKLKEAAETINGLKAFDVSGKVRYFVYEYLKQQKQESSDIIEKVKSQVTEKIAVSARTEAEAELKCYKDKLETLRAEVEKDKQEHAELVRQVANQLEQQRTDYAKKTEELEVTLTEQTGKLTGQLEEVEQKLEDQTRTVGDIKDKQAAYEHSVKLLETKVETQQDQLDTVLTQSELKLKEFIEKEKKALHANKNEHASEEIKAEIWHQQQKYAEQIDRAQWKIGTLVGEIEKLLLRNKRKDRTEIDTSPVSRSKIPVMAFITILVLVIAGGIGAGYLYLNAGDTYKDLFKRAVPVLFSAEQKGNEVAFDLPVTVTENEITGVDTEELTEYETQPEPEEDLSVRDMLTRIQDLVDEQAYNPVLNLQNQPEQIEEFSSSEPVKTAFELGLMYYSGKDVERDYSKAFEYFLESADEGNSVAMYNVGRMCHKGIGVEVDGIKAVGWYEKAAQQGLTKAMNQLAEMYYFDDMVELDYKKAAEYYERSAKKGDLKAMYNLAFLYYTGVGVDTDVRKAMLWFIKAARGGDPDAMCQLGVMFESDDSIKKDIEKALYWYQNAARAGQEDAKKRLIKLGKTW